jgi:hypothetical protein
MQESHLRQLLAAQEPRLPYSFLGDEILTPQWGRRSLLFLHSSSEFWALPPAERQQAPTSLVVCWRHNSCLPCPTLSLEEGYCYDAYELPKWFSLAGNLTRKSAPVFRGALLAGLQEAYQRLAALPRSTRRRYERDLQSMLLRRGRPRRDAKRG